jgi:hypothetical protein
MTGAIDKNSDRWRTGNLLLDGILSWTCVSRDAESTRMVKARADWSDQDTHRTFPRVRRHRMRNFVDVHVEARVGVLGWDSCVWRRRT